MFLGDGSYRNASEITFSLNRLQTRMILILYIIMWRKIYAKITETKCIIKFLSNDLCVNINVNSDYLRGLLNNSVLGTLH